MPRRPQPSISSARAPLVRAIALAAPLFAACATTASLHPQAPVVGQIPPLPDAPPSRVVVHTTIFAEAVRAQLDANLPREGAGDVPLALGRTAPYKWTRTPVEVRFERGRIVVSTHAVGHIPLFGDLPIDLVVAGEPIISADYQAQLQSTDVRITVASSIDAVRGYLTKTLHDLIAAQLDAFKLDVRPLVAALHGRIARPLPLDLGGRTGCAELRVSGIEAGPTIYAGGMEKDLGVVILPSVTLPCSPSSTQPTTLPLLQNVANVPSGPFTVTIPIAADYAELSRALESSMKGRLHFSPQYPDLYLEKPSVYPSRDTVVIKLNLGGRLKVGPFSTSLSGELYFSGHPKVIDNQIVVPDLELTPGTADGLLKLKFLVDGKAIRDQAQAALRVDLSERVHAARGKLSTELSFEDGSGCVRAEVLRSEVTGIYPHDSFLRIYVSLSAQAQIYMPCKH